MFFSSLHASQKSPKVVVIGAGLSGLTAAYRLQQGGIDVEVYEARNRVGGRVFSIHLNGHIGELGAQNILNGGEAKHVLGLVHELGLETEQRKSIIHFNYYEEGEFFDFSRLLKERNFTKEKLESQLSQILPSARNMKDVLQALFEESDILYKMCQYMLSDYEGGLPENLSTVYSSTLSHFLLGGVCSAHPNHGEELSSMDHQWVKGGNQLLAEKISEKVLVHLNFPLVAITKSQDRYLLTFKNGTQVFADILVLAIPCSVYRDIQIDSEVIPIKKQKDFQSIQYGTCAKILIPIDRIAFQREHYINGRLGTFINGDGYLLNLFYVQEHGKFSSESIGERYQQALPLVDKGYVLQSTLLPILAFEDAVCYLGPVGHSWPMDPYAKGSYYYIAPGQEELLTRTETIAGEHVKSLFAPIDNSLFFAGEHPSILFDVAGTMEAAVEAGERTARLIQKLQ